MTKIIAGTTLIIVSMFMLNRLYKDTSYPGHQHINTHKEVKGFIEHSALMWINNNLKSLSERNFLVPFFTYTLGAGAANLFKISNDAALLFYRIVIKTIGTTDTALLSHIEVSGQQRKLMPIAFKKLTARVAGLCLPLLGIIGFLFLEGNELLYDTFVFQSFMLMVVGYLVEVMFLSYERVLEIKRRYLLLMFSYIPYIVIVFLLVLGYVVPFLGLLGTIALVHGVRLVSLICIVVFARHYYQLTFPLYFVLSRTCMYIVIVYVVHILVAWYVPMGKEYVSLLLSHLIKLSPTS